MNYYKTKKVLVAKNDAGEFFSLDISFGSTTPGRVNSPIDAYHILPWKEAEFKNPKPAPYYFENSARMRDWLEGFKMVAVEIQMEAYEL